MTIKEFANLPQNLNGFWVEHYSRHSWRVYHNGLSTIAPTISHAKQDLRDRVNSPWFLMMVELAKIQSKAVESLSSSISKEYLR